MAADSDSTVVHLKKLLFFFYRLEVNSNSGTVLI